MYYASGTVLIGSLGPADSSLTAWIQKLGDPADLESQLLIAKSTRMLRLVLERAGVADAVREECHKDTSLRQLLAPIDCSKLKPGSKEMLVYVSPRYSVRAEGRSRVISIGYRSPVPEVSFILANALLITYLEDQRAENPHARESAAAWVLEADKKLNESGSPANQAGQSKKSFYQDLYSKASDFETERRNLPNPGRLVSLAEIPEGPYFPQPIPLLAAGFTLATLLAAFVALRSDLADQSMHRTRDLEILTSETVLGLLPRASAFRRRRGVLLPDAADADWQSPRLAEAVRTLYARLLLAISHDKGRCILVASAAPGEGKTPTTIALARAASESGRRVLVIDCDLRAAAVAIGSGSSAAKGLTGILRGEIDPQEAAVQTGLQGLEIIQAGPAVSNPTMLLIDGQLPKLMNWAKQYDLILLNGPTGLLPDVPIFAAHADGVLWCVRWGRTLLPNIKADLEELHKQQVKLLGFVVTMVDLKDMRYYQRFPRYSRWA
jgi:capsular exopolysaccharide synthesis family protein